MRTRREPLPRPYKFLDSYNAADREIFVARDHEAEVLVGDIISSRLVVLFAKTGTGKTSLIKAGVRPRLEDVDYATFYVRVEHDPVAAVRGVLRDARVIPEAFERELRTLPDVLRHVSKTLDKPVVVFFDQFEEFFIHFGATAHAEKVGAFIGDVTELYRDREAGVHVVFSMREEYFVEMDVFRDSIPSIFHNESSLRLRPFRREQALQAVILPAERRGVAVDPGVAERIVDELEVEGVVEPSRLSIVCDTLWEEGGKRALRLADLERLGGPEAIVSQRLEQDVAKLSDEHLELLVQLLPRLKTERGTKYLRGFDDLVGSTGADPALLEALVEELKGAHLVHESVINRARYVEWASDYLAERTDLLSRRARVILNRRLLDDALARARRPRDGGSLLDSVLPLTREQLERLAASLPELDLAPDEARLALITALALGVPARAWWEEAVDKGVDVWALMRDVLSGRPVTQPVASAIDLLADVGSDDAVAVLEDGLADPALAPDSFDALVRIRTDAAAQALERALDDDSQATRAIDSLRQMGTHGAIGILAERLRGGGTTGLEAGTALDTLASEPATLGHSDEAKAVLAPALDQRAEFLFEEALRVGAPPRFWFDHARNRSVDVWAKLRVSVTNAATQLERAESAVRLLAELDDPADEPTALELLRLAAAQPHLRDQAERALEARGALERVRVERAGEESRARASRRAGDAVTELTWRRLLHDIHEGRCVPIVGPGATAGVLPLGAELAQSLTYRYDLPLDDARDLPRVCETLALTTDRAYMAKAVAEVIRSAGLPDFSAPDEPHAVLAQLPLGVYLTANFDGILEAALANQAREPSVQFGLRQERESRSTFPDVTPERPLVIHLYGHVSQPESLVLTDDDFIRAAVEFALDQIESPAASYAVARGSLLAIGLSPISSAWRVFRNAILDRSDAVRRSSVMVQLPPDDERSRELLDRQLNEMGFVAYWGTAHEFARELAVRWREDVR